VGIMGHRQRLANSEGWRFSYNSLPDSFIRLLEDRDLNTEPTRRGSARNRPLNRFLLGSVGVVVLGMAMATGSSPAAAKYVLKHRSAHKEAVNKLPFGDIPKGPLEIFVSINQQRLHFYSDGVHVADAPVATGVPGHLTPLGVFDVIQRDRYHHSNIYDNAPMPYMERITWSGVALHEGEGVGHQASHGCIRMPHDFAARLWMLPTMGMRVIIARPELRPLDFTDPHLFVHKDASTAVLPLSTETAQSVAPGTKSDIVEPANPPANASPATGANVVPAAAPSTAGAAQPAESPPAAASAPASAASQNAASTAPTTSTPPRTSPDKPGAAALAGGPGGAAANATPPNKAAEPVPATPAPAQPAAAAANTSPVAPAPAGPPTQPPSTQPANAAASGASPAVPAEAASVGAASANITAPISLDDVPLPPVKPSQLGATSGGPIAIFVSRKESKIYVRQNFTPLFDAPVKIEDPSQPLGTHVFTAMDYLPDHASFRWTVVTLPTTPPKGAERWKYVRDAWGRKRRVRVVELLQEAAPAPQDTPEEALARIQIPQDVINQISQLIVPGSSLVVSDQGLGPETGEGTDFIVVTR
jgi:hypothetical protein